MVVNVGGGGGAWAEVCRGNGENGSASARVDSHRAPGLPTLQTCRANMYRRKRLGNQGEVFRPSRQLASRQLVSRSSEPPVIPFSKQALDESVDSTL
jgi:hypothetical protein